MVVCDVSVLSTGNNFGGEHSKRRSQFWMKKKFVLLLQHIRYIIITRSYSGRDNFHLIGIVIFHFAFKGTRFDNDIIILLYSYIPKTDKHNTTKYNIVIVLPITFYIKMKTARYIKLLFFFPYKYLQKSDKTAKRSEIITHCEIK